MVKARARSACAGKARCRTTSRAGSCPEDHARRIMSGGSMPGIRDPRRLPAPVMLVEPSLCFHHTARAGREARAMLAGEPRCGRRANRKLGGIEVAPAGDAVDVLAVGIRSPARPFADQFLALTLGETLG